eukprot:SAG11_NODE_22002_length_414_cov_0.815873_1_plen_41_part_10
MAEAEFGRGSSRGAPNMDLGLEAEEEGAQQYTLLLKANVLV